MAVRRWSSPSASCGPIQPLFLVCSFIDGNEYDTWP
jgi:hypothetical protein